MTTSSQPLVSIILLNWNNADDTIECLRSVRQLDYSPMNIVLIDNGSTDGSVQRLTDWLTSEKITYQVGPAEQIKLEPADRVTVITSPTNRGYAAGNNLGLRLAIGQTNLGYVWILNNDTTVAPDALTKLVTRAQREPKVGLCGSLVCYADSPEVIQLQGGGSYQPLWATSRHIGADRPRPAALSTQTVESSLNYISGASVLVSRDFLATVGLMDERYFLFYEEIDWSLAARGRFHLGYAPESLVYHKVGARSGSGREARQRSDQADFHGLKSRILLTKKYFPWFLPTVYLALLGALIKRLLRGRPAQAWQCGRLLLSGGQARPPAF